MVASYDEGSVKGFLKDLKKLYFPDSGMANFSVQEEGIQNNWQHAQVWPSNQVHTESRYTKILKKKKRLQKP